MEALKHVNTLKRCELKGNGKCPWSNCKTNDADNLV